MVQSFWFFFLNEFYMFFPPPPINPFNEKVIEITKYMYKAINES